MFAAPLGVAGEFKAGDGEISVALLLDGRLEQGTQGRLVPSQNELVRRGDAMEWAGGIGAQNQRIVQNSRSLQNGSASCAAAENGNGVLLAEGEVDLGCCLVGVAKSDERLCRFPKTEQLIRKSRFAQAEQRLVARQIFRRRGQGEVAMVHLLDFTGFWLAMLSNAARL
jgi:hypothetical protein